MKHYRYYIRRGVSRGGHDVHRVVARKDEDGNVLEHWVITCLVGNEAQTTVFYGKGRYSMGKLPRKVMSWRAIPGDVRETFEAHAEETRSASRRNTRSKPEPEYYPADAQS